MSDPICDKRAPKGFDVSGLLADKGGACVVDEARAILDEARLESCGRCVFCREGSLQLHEILRDGTSGKSEDGDLELLAELASMVRDNAGCEMAGAAAAALVSLMERYSEEFEQHFKRARCPALQCKAYYSVHVLPDACTGCGACLVACPENAISGGEGMIHVIDQDACTRCGACLKACQSRAIAKAGAVKPRTPESPAPVGSWGQEGGEASGGRRRRRRGGDDDSEGSAKV